MNSVIENLKNKLNTSSIKDYSEAMKIIDFSADIQDTSILSQELLREIIQEFPANDSVKISILNDADDAIIISNESGELRVSNLDDFEAETAILKCHIEKEITDNNHLNIYCYEKFCDSLKDKSLIEIISMFAYLLMNREFIIFDIMDSNILFSTKSFVFKGNTIVGNWVSSYREERITLVRENSNFRNMSIYNVLPEDFSFEHKNENNKLENIFGKIECLLSMIYIANDAEIKQNTLKIRISGQRNIDMECLLNEVEYNKEVIKIYNWIYNGGNVADKAVIARNILSLHCKFADLLHIDEKTFSSIQSNYTIYQKENVDKYLELKNIIAEKINEMIEKTNELALSVPNGIKNNILAVFSFLFTVVLANVVSDAPLTNVFTRDITVIFEIVLVSSFVFLAYTLYETNYKIKKMELGYEKLKENYEDIFDETELQDIFKNDSFEHDIIKEIKKIRNATVVLWIILIILGIIVIEIISSSSTFDIIFKYIKG